MKLNKIVLSSIASFALMFALAGTVSADGSCTTQYGGTVTCPPDQITINKQVWNPDPKVKAWYENLGVKNAFALGNKGIMGDTVLFNLIVKNNTSDVTMDVTVKDIFPYFLMPVSYPGTREGQAVTFTMSALRPGEERTQVVEGRVVDASALSGPTSVCARNIGQAFGPDNRFAEDKAELCIGEAPASTLPVAGFEDMALLIPFIGVGAGGLALLRKRG